MTPAGFAVTPASFAMTPASFAIASASFAIAPASFAITAASFAMTPASFAMTAAVQPDSLETLLTETSGYTFVVSATATWDLGCPRQDLPRRNPIGSGPLTETWGHPDRDVGHRDRDVGHRDRDVEDAAGDTVLGASTGTGSPAHEPSSRPMTWVLSHADGEARVLREYELGLARRPVDVAK